MNELKAIKQQELQSNTVELCHIDPQAQADKELALKLQ